MIISDIKKKKKKLVLKNYYQERWSTLTGNINRIVIWAIKQHVLTYKRELLKATLLIKLLVKVYPLTN